MDKNWATMSPFLAEAGYCVFAFNYGNRVGLGPIGKSAAGARAFVDRVRRATGTRRSTSWDTARAG